MWIDKMLDVCPIGQPRDSEAQELKQRTVAQQTSTDRRPECGLCLETGVNSLAALSEHVDVGLIMPRGQC